MKKLLKSEVCGSREQCTGPTGVMKRVEKSNILLLFMNSSMNSEIYPPEMRVAAKKKMPNPNRY